MAKRASTIGGTGLASYADSSYDFTTTPATDSIIYSDEGDKTLNLLFHINEYPNGELTHLIEPGSILEDIEYTNVDSWITTLYNQGNTSTAHGCRAARTGCSITCTAGAVSDTDWS